MKWNGYCLAVIRLHIDVTNCPRQTSSDGLGKKGRKVTQALVPILWSTSRRWAGLLGAIFFTLLWRIYRLNTALPLKSRAVTFCNSLFLPWRHIISSIVYRLEGEYFEFEFACALCRRYKQSHSVEKCKEKKQIFGFNPFQTQTPGVGLTVLFPTCVSWVFMLNFR